MTSQISERIDEIQQEVKAIKLTLGSFVRFKNNETERLLFLESQINEGNYLAVYYDFDKQDLIKLLLEKEKQQTGKNRYILLVLI